MSLVTKRAIAEQVEKHKQEIVKLRQMQLATSPDLREVYDTPINIELEALSLIYAESLVSE